MMISKGRTFTIQALRLFHDPVEEILVVDNNPSSADGQTIKDFLKWVPNARYIPFTQWKGTAKPRDLVFEQATSDWVLCLDPHVFLAPGSLTRYRQFMAEHPDSLDLYQGPLIYDDLQGVSTHFQDEWRGEMWGTWGTDERGKDPNHLPFEIPAQGLGLFSCRKKAWLGFNDSFRGFGGEEWYIHTKFRQQGRKTWCLPFLRWLHRFGRPRGVPYPLDRYHKARNYYLGHQELGLDITPIHDHFVKSGLLTEEHWQMIQSGQEHPQQKSSCGGCHQPQMSLTEALELAWNTPGDIHEHVPYLRELASQCDHVTAFGGRHRVSTVALLHGVQKKLVVYDTNIPEITWLQKEGGEKFQAHIQEGKNAEIEETDLLFIDSVHRGDYVYQELLNTASKGKVRRWIIFHDTEIFGERGEDGGPGLLSGIRRFLKEHPQWVVKEHRPNNHGLTVLSCDPQDKKELPSNARMGWNFFKHKVKDLMNGGKLLPLEMAEKRMEQCLLCDQRTDNRCAKCGCFLDHQPNGDPGKTFYPGEFCPLGKWHSEQVPE